MNLLVATDGSKAPLHDLKYAVGLVRQLATSPNSVTLIRGHDDEAYRHAEYFVGKKVVADYLRKASEKELKASRKLLDAAGLRHDTEVPTGRVSKEIVDCASSGKFELLIMGAQGRSGIADPPLGSVAQRVLATAEISLLLMKSPAVPASSAVVGDPEDAKHAQRQPAASAASLRIHSGVSCRP